VGYKGGYELVENVYCRIRSVNKELLGASEGVYLNETPTASIGTYPILTDGDMLVAKHNKRYRIRSVKSRESQGFITAQTFNIELMQLTDMCYLIPAPALKMPTQRQGSNCLKQSENNSVNHGIGGQGFAASNRNSLGVETAKIQTTRTGTGVGKGFTGENTAYPPA
jgi:chromosome condensin MukBEF MukE localization factor